MSTTIYDIAERADVSTATVSRVFNDESGVSEDTRQHVLDAAAALNYRPHASAQNLARQHTNQIAVVAPVVANYFYMHVMRGIQHALADRDMDLMVHAPANPQDRIHEQPDPKSLNTYMARALQPGRNDGILLLSMPLTDEWADRLAETSRAVVLVDGEHPRFESFAVDSREGGYKATQHLIDRGYERIGHITVEYDPPPARYRREGYEQALRDDNRAVQDKLIAASDERPFAFSEKGGYRAMTTLLGRKPRPDAVFAASDMQAMGAMQAAHENDLRVPEDLAIVGFDDLELSRCAGLTTLRQPARTMGARATRTLLRRIEAAGAPPVSSTVFSPELVVRRTCGERPESEAASPGFVLRDQ
ncbi:LacI family DNA-binding transcriptional regulator [Salinibacter ruber]|uniref:LacI family transcriptional regulator n=1 Tax=Salinibacter ruber TaxID=146919 RepID=A0A9X2PKF6_9BACT|nr:LacI family DNA-binding transcriptional regulator [Salinibacter ruber]MBB4089686.1 LacI family transcriptional regulator [Salinibacter ruber]MCS3610180.1 LacI family transcriptional regulator [Salinibacter ruber]MCS3614805.1 LacI family transcriptional regulator [Salinibacter ruber]MCS3627818.1 LacI family transcriptional regulator [Salinibacter ruber]MCS3635143.1 LacI family transcriptional regulator [Salinibacter ruber]